MKKAFHLLLFCLCQQITFGQIPTLSFENLESQNLKGKVKLVKTRSFNANKVNGAFVKTTKTCCAIHSNFPGLSRAVVEEEEVVAFALGRGHDVIQVLAL